jgi:hypothetical protein
MYIIPKAISWLATCISWAGHIGARNYAIRDQYDAALNALANDPLLRKNPPGIRRKVHCVGVI